MSCPSYVRQSADDFQKLLAFYTFLDNFSLKILLYSENTSFSLRFSKISRLTINVEILVKCHTTGPLKTGITPNLCLLISFLQYDHFYNWLL